MIIGAPYQRPMTRFHWPAGGRLFRPIAPAEQIAVADGVVPRAEGLTSPPELEDSFGDPALISRILVDRSPALSRPSNDLDREALWRVDQASIALKTMVAGPDERRLICPSHASCRDVGDVRRIKIHDVFLSRGVSEAVPKSARLQSP